MIRVFFLVSALALISACEIESEKVPFSILGCTWDFDGKLHQFSSDRYDVLSGAGEFDYYFRVYSIDEFPYFSEPYRTYDIAENIKYAGGVEHEFFIVSSYLISDSNNLKVNFPPSFYAVFRDGFDQGILVYSKKFFDESYVCE